MDREIKFRAFDSKRKSFTNYQIMDDLILFFEKHTGCWLSNKENRFKLMQCTGVKDQNGKEIYEGDILLDVDDDYLVVEYINGSFVAKVVNEIFPLKVISSVSEIVGNKYKNSELLEGME